MFFTSVYTLISIIALQWVILMNVYNCMMCVLVKKSTQKIYIIKTPTLNCLVLFSGQHLAGKSRIGEQTEDPN